VAIEAVTFDVTGTLIHCPRMPEIYAEVLGRHGASVSAEEVAHHFPIVWKELDCLVPSGVDRFSQHPEGARGWWCRLLERLCELLEAPAPSKFAAAELFNRFARAEAWDVFPEAPEVLAALGARGCRLGVVANWDSRLPGLLEDLGLLDSFDSVVFSSALGIAKPNPEVFVHVMEELAVDPSAAAHIGDSRIEDIEGAIAAGMTGLHLDRDSRREDAVADLREVVAILERRS
jgi:putative hydrolase of the HAD superfamily